MPWWCLSSGRKERVKGPSHVLLTILTQLRELGLLNYVQWRCIALILKIDINYLKLVTIMITKRPGRHFILPVTSRALLVEILVNASLSTGYICTKIFS